MDDGPCTHTGDDIDFLYMTRRQEEREMGDPQERLYELEWLATLLVIGVRNRRYTKLEEVSSEWSDVVYWSRGMDSLSSSCEPTG